MRVHHVRPFAVVASVVVSLLVSSGCDAPSKLDLVPDGQACRENGNASCASGHCDGGICCQTGNCCQTVADCPESFHAAPTCADPTGATTCQGTRRDATCAANVCGTVTVPDDSGCTGAVRGCGAYASVACTADATQPVAACETGCADDTACSAGHTCVQGACTAIVGLGDACVGGGQGSCGEGLKCENGVCCGAADATCCSDAAQCGSGLACNAATSSCYTSCTSYDASRCASAAAYCLGNACIPKLQTGAGCANAGECASGFCVDGVCCASACDGTCAACAAARTGLADGTCAPVLLGLSDDVPGALCTAAGQGCGGGAPCACDGAGTCKLANGDLCAAAQECASGACECFDASCTTRRCRAGWCGQCQLAASATTCGAGLGAPSPVDDPNPADACSGPVSCYAGVCRKDAGQACTANSECGGVCINGACGAPSAVGGACDATEDCLSPNVCVSGVCKIPQGSSCQSANQCATGNCADGVCCNTACNQATCAACNLAGSVGTCTMPADDSACGTISCSGRNTTCRTYASLTTNRCESIGACKPANSTTYCTGFASTAAGTDCGTCATCNGVGDCVGNSTDHADCQTCQKCSSGVCVAQTSAEDLKGECDTTCGTGLCSGSGTCGYYAYGTACNDALPCTFNDQCDGAGHCSVSTAYSCASTTCAARSCNGAGGCNEACLNDSWSGGSCRCFDPETRRYYDSTIECSCVACQESCDCAC